MSRVDDETPPPGWVPSEETLERVRTAPMLDLDAHLAPIGPPDPRGTPVEFYVNGRRCSGFIRWQELRGSYTYGMRPVLPTGERASGSDVEEDCG